MGSLLSRRYYSSFCEALGLPLPGSYPNWNGKSRHHWGPQWSPDFLFPSRTDAIPFSSPCSYHHALALIRFYTQCSWLTPPLLTPEQAKHLSTHSMKSTLLPAAGGQFNLNLEQCAKQGHHKKSVQLYSRDDVWPSLFLQRDILVDSSTGWRPLTSQSRGAKQPLPEPPFPAPPITQADLQLLQMVTPKLTPQTPGQTADVTKEQQAPLSDSDSEDTSSSSSSSSSSEDEDISSSSSWSPMTNRMLSMRHELPIQTHQNDPALTPGILASR